MINSMYFHNHTAFKRSMSGFTLVEIAIVLLIVTLLMTGLVPTISSQVEQRQVNETRKQLEEIKQALIGYTVIHGRLPCPSSTADPANANYGLETCVALTEEGYLPWKTLGVPETDAWGSKRASVGSPGYWRYRADINFTAAFSLTTGFTDKLSIVDSSNTLITQATGNCTAANPTSECPVAIVFSTGPNLVPNGKNALAYLATNAIYQSDVPGANFDDIMIWISRPQLFNRMVAAGKLP